MYHTQSRPIPERIYEPNIIHNPRTWMGIWTPHGWRVHRKRWGRAQRFTVSLSGDGRTTFFPEALIDPTTGKVGWQDDLHLSDDPFTDAGIYPSDPRVEYPVGRPRWAVSHTLLWYPVADHNLYTHEYLWDMVHGHLQTHFRKHVPLEGARTDEHDGMTVTVRNTPISRTIEGNVHYPMPNSAVRGVWATPDRTGPNLYTRRIRQLISMHNGVYAVTPHVPVVQCHGVWAVLPDDPLGEVFDADTGECTDVQRVVEELRIPFDVPKIALMIPPYVSVPSKIYEGSVLRLAEHEGTVNEQHLAELRRRLGARFVMGKVGYEGQRAVNADSTFYQGYEPCFDLNGNGVVDEQDADILAAHLGRRVRYNCYNHAYLGGNWLTNSINFTCEHEQGVPMIADYEYGAGYDGMTGVVRLRETPGPGQTVWVEYHCDAPAEPGEDNIRVHLYREVPA